MRSSQIGFDPRVQQQKSWAVQISKFQSGGKITELRIHICRFEDEKRQCFGLGVCTVFRNSPQSTPHFTITTIHKGHFQNVALSSQTATLLLQSGTLLSPHKIHAPKASDA